MILLHELDAPTFTGGRVLFFRGGDSPLLAHDIPHPIGDPDEDEGLPGDDDDDDEDDDGEDDEEPMQLRGGRPFCTAAQSTKFWYNQNLAAPASEIF